MECHSVNMHNDNSFSLTGSLEFTI